MWTQPIFECCITLGLKAHLLVIWWGVSSCHHWAPTCTVQMLSSVQGHNVCFNGLHECDSATFNPCGAQMTRVPPCLLTQLYQTRFRTLSSTFAVCLTAWWGKDCNTYRWQIEEAREVKIYQISGTSCVSMSSINWTSYPVEIVSCINLSRRAILDLLCPVTVLFKCSEVTQSILHQSF